MSQCGVATGLAADLEAELIRHMEQQRLGMQVVRRCRDVAELLGVVKAGLVQFAVLDTEVIYLDAAAVEELSASGVPVLVLAPLDDVPALQKAGAFTVLAKADPRVEPPAEPESQQILHYLMQQIMPPPPPSPLDAPASEGQRQRENGDIPGKILAFWGPPGAAGRSSLALNLAAALRGYGSVLLVDADTVEPSLVQMLGLELGSSGLVTGCRLLEQGRLDEDSSPDFITKVGPGVDLLTGLTKAERWREVGQKSLAALLEWARARYRWVLVDLAPGATNPGETLAIVGPSRQQAQSATFSVADLVIEVGLADPVGLRRLIVNHQWARDCGLWECPGMAVVNRGRSSVAGSSWESAVRRALTMSDALWVVTTVRQAVAEFDQAVVAGCDIATLNPEAAVLQDLEKVKTEIIRLVGLLPKRNSGKPRGNKSARRGQLLKGTQKND